MAKVTNTQGQDDRILVCNISNKFTVLMHMGLMCFHLDTEDALILSYNKCVNLIVYTYLY